MSTSRPCSTPLAPCSPTGRTPARSCAPRSAKSSPTSIPPPPRTPVAASSRSSRCHREDCGAGRSQVALTTTDAWLGAPLAVAPSIDDVVLRYLGAFGPATPGDVAAWSRLTGFREIVERLRPRLRPFRDERGRELYDLPDAPRPDPDTPAPPRFLPEYDNVLLSHADRTRFVSQDHRSWIFNTPAPVHGTVLHDGFMAGTWSIDRDDGAVLTIRPVVSLSKRATAALEAEGRRMLRFLEPDVDALDVRTDPIG